MRIEVLPDAEAVAAAGAERLVARAREGGHIALSGGSTPARMHELAAERLGDWSGAVLWFGDDRAVPPHHEHSNYAMARATLLDRIDDAAAPRVERILGERGAEKAADDYDDRRRAAPDLDLAVMGLGPDAHTASLFPGRPAVQERRRLAVAETEPGMEPLVPRVTLTLPVFEAAAEVVFLVAGAAKRDAVRRAFGPEPDPASPAARLRRANVTVLCDEAAAP